MNEYRRQEIKRGAAVEWGESNSEGLGDGTARRSQTPVARSLSCSDRLRGDKNAAKHGSIPVATSELQILSSAGCFRPGLHMTT
jgi:hypothetical protein